MAKAKKKETLSLEEKLELALVPVDEQPYEVPENWCWVYALSLFIIEYGKGLPTKELIEEGYPVFGANGQIGYYLEYMYEDEKALMSCRGAYSGTMNRSLPKSYVTSNSLIIADKGNVMMPKYICYMFDALDTSKLVSGSAQPQVTVQAFEKYPVLLPPLEEQRRIVKQIETLFAKLDDAKEKIINELDKFEDRKMAILHEAYLGNLTTEWRDKNSVGFDTWVEKSSSELFEYVTSGSRGWAKYYSDEGALFIRMGNLDHGTIEIDFADTQYVNLPNKAEGQRSLLRKDDILISITADVGMIGLVRELPQEAYINQHVALARPVKTNNAEFLAWYLVSDLGFVQMRDKQRGATKVGLGLDDIRSLKLKLPTRDEQEEIVKIINKLMKKEEHVRESLLNVIEEIELMKKAILAKAFRGELGTNNPNEESAIKLLKQIIAEER